MFRWIIGVFVFLLLFIGAIIFVNCFDFVDNTELGYKFDARTGVVTKLEHSGWYLTPPIVVKIHTIDLRPKQVCINANQRVLNCKLVQFNPEGLEVFLAWHGRKDYSTASDAVGEFADILKSYAYDGSGKSYPFLTVLRDLRPEEASAGDNK